MHDARVAKAEVSAIIFFKLPIDDERSLFPLHTINDKKFKSMSAACEKR